MEISYLGHSAFKVKTKGATWVSDPYGSEIGLTLPSVSADVVTVSHRGHKDHEAVELVSGTTRRPKPFVIDEPGEYEVEGISVFGYQTWHDDKQGTLRGPNTIYLVQAEEIRILHLGDLGHSLDDKLLSELESVDVLMAPVGGHYTIDAKQVMELAGKLDPTYILPMHYRTDEHNQEVFGKLATRDEFVQYATLPSRSVKSLTLNKLSMPEDLTEVIVFE